MDPKQVADIVTASAQKPGKPIKVQSPRRKRLIRVLFSVLLVGGAVTLIAMSGSDAAALYKHVDEVNADPASFDGKLLKVHGHVVPGTVVVKIVDQATHYSFDLEWKGQVISVEQVNGEFPDTVKDNSEVVATGRLLSPGRFKSTELSAKCASKYKAGAGGSSM